MIHVYATNEAGLPDDEFRSTVDALFSFAADVGRAWHLCYVAVSTIRATKGDWRLRFVPSLSEAPGALGYHDEEGIRPDMLIGVSECERAGVSVSSCAAHELAEALVDPHINAASFDGRSKFWATEVGDPVQDESYEIKGIEVSNFVKPNWFNPDATGNFDFLGTRTQPFTISPGGYAQYVDLNDPEAGWKQVGAELSVPAPRKRGER